LDNERCTVLFDRVSVLSHHLRSAGCLQSAHGEVTMLTIAGILAIGLLIYLFLALLKPELFG
jgi:K+-transporting ATPase KdpF subunit